jgi:hypothetical protein
MRKLPALTAACVAAGALLVSTSVAQKSSGDRHLRERHGHAQHSGYTQASTGVKLSGKVH